MSARKPNSIAKKVVGFLFCVLAWAALSATVRADNWRGIAQVAAQTKQQNIRLPLPWLTQLRMESESHTIRRANGSSYMTRPRVVTSGYDRRVQYDVSKFYEVDHPRLNFVLRYAGRMPGEVISVGGDSGYSAAKIRVKPALFLGYTRALKLAEHTMLTLGISGWIGGAVRESACRDSYNSEYYCPTLTAWRDYQPPDNSVDIEYGLVWTYRF